MASDSGARKSGQMYWKCDQKQCTSHVSTNNFDPTANQPNIQIDNHSGHNHPPPPSEAVSRADFIEEMRDRIITNPTIPLKRIYNDISGNRAEIPSFLQIESACKRVRKDNVPRVPRNKNEVAINGDWVRTWSDDLYLLHIDNAAGVCVFATDDDL